MTTVLYPYAPAAAFATVPLIFLDHDDVVTLWRVVSPLLSRTCEARHEQGDFSASTDHLVSGWLVRCCYYSAPGRHIRDGLHSP